MKKSDTSKAVLAIAFDANAAVSAATEAVYKSFEHLCLTAGIAALSQMLEEDAQALAGDRHARDPSLPGYRWGRTTGPVGFHGGKVEVERPRVRCKTSRKELPLPTWQEAADSALLQEWAMNQMLLNVATRKFNRSVRLPEAGISAVAGSGLTRSAVSRRFVALSQTKLDEWMASDMSDLDILVIQIDGLHLKEDLLMVGAVGIDAEGNKHPLGVVEGATENTATVQALMENLISRGLDPTVCRLFIVDGAKALTKAIRRTFGADTPIQRCQVHKARNIIDRLPKRLHASVRATLRQAWEINDVAKAERLLRNLANRLEHEAPGVSASILEGLDEILTVNRLGLPPELRRALATTNIIESMNAVIRQTCRNVKRWRDAKMGLRWTAAGMREAAKGFRRLKAHKQLSALKVALAKHRQPASTTLGLDDKAVAA